MREVMREGALCENVTLCTLARAEQAPAGVLPRGAAAQRRERAAALGVTAAHGGWHGLGAV